MHPWSVGTAKASRPTAPLRPLCSNVDTASYSLPSDSSAQRFTDGSRFETGTDNCPARSRRPPNEKLCAGYPHVPGTRYRYP